MPRHDLYAGFLCPVLLVEQVVSLQIQHTRCLFGVDRGAFVDMSHSEHFVGNSGRGQTDVHNKYVRIVVERIVTAHAASRRAPVSDVRILRHFILGPSVRSLFLMGTTNSVTSYTTCSVAFNHCIRLAVLITYHTVTVFTIYFLYNIDCICCLFSVCYFAEMIHFIWFKTLPMRSVTLNCWSLASATFQVPVVPTIFNTTSFCTDGRRMTFGCLTFDDVQMEKLRGAGLSQMRGGDIWRAIDDCVEIWSAAVLFDIATHWLNVEIFKSGRDGPIKQTVLCHQTPHLG